MILQALAEYYERKGDDLPAIGWLVKGVDYAVVLKPDGTVHNIECLQKMDGEKAIPFPCVVPMIGKQALKHTNTGTDANLLWDNAGFVLGSGKKGEKKRASFLETLSTWLSDVDDEGLNAVRAFYDSSPDADELLESLGANEAQTEAFMSGTPTLAFRLLGVPGFIHSRDAIKSAVAEKWPLLTENGGDGVCLITGQAGSIEDCHLVTKGVWGAQPSGANLVAFNAPPFESHGHEGGANAPVGKRAAFAYTTALNHLLRKDSRQRLQVGDASTVFWAERPATLENGFLSLFGEPPKDNPDEGVDAVASLRKSIENAALTEDESKNRFHVLGLAPNAARIAVRFWIVDTVAGISRKIVQHFDDLRIAHGPHDRDTLSLFRLLVSTAALGKSENVPPNLVGDTMRAILTGQRYPQTLLQAAVRRNRAEQSVTYARAMLIKACLNRKTRFDNPQEKEELKVSLDTGNKNIGYRLGRLFAALEKIQGEANPGLNATIRDRFYGAASGTPIAVFSNLMRLKNHHLSKLDSPGRRVTFEKLIAEILSNVDGQIGFPPTLSMPDQGRFAIGYYHQTQDFYTKKEKPANTDSKEEGNDNE